MFGLVACFDWTIFHRTSNPRDPKKLTFQNSSVVL